MMNGHVPRGLVLMTALVMLAACSAGGSTTMSGSGGAAPNGAGGSGGAAMTGAGGSGGAATGSGGRASGGSGGSMSGAGGAVSGSGGFASGSGGASSSGGVSGGAGGASGGAGASVSGSGGLTGGAPGSGGKSGSGGGAAGGVGSGGAAGTTAGAGGGPASPCAARSGVLFCEDFESRAAGPAGNTPPWVPQIIGSGTLTIDGTTAHSGGKSLHVHAGDDDYDTLLAFHDATVLPAPNGRFYARAFVRLGRAMAAGHNSYIVAELFATPGTGNNLRIAEDNAMLMYTIKGDSFGALSNANYYTDHKPGVAFAPSTWVCLEFLIDAGHPELDFWVDGTEVPDLHHTDWALDHYDTLRFGFEKYAGPGIDIWYDDIAIGTSRIGCQ